MSKQASHDQGDRPKERYRAERDEREERGIPATFAFNPNPLAPVNTDWDGGRASLEPPGAGALL